jgi:hypothetical protein
VQPFYACLMSVEEQLEAKPTSVTQGLLDSGFFPIGSNGASELLAISAEEGNPVYAFDALDAARMRRRLKVSDTFEQFVAMLGVCPGNEATDV